jgi:hypothetical protein
VTWMCRVLGHTPTFSVDGRTMRWACGRCGQAEGAKEYGTSDEARRYATAFNKRDSDDLGKRAPLIGLLPLRLWRRFRRP